MRRCRVVGTACRHSLLQYPAIERNAQLELVLGARDFEALYYRQPGAGRRVFNRGQFGTLERRTLRVHEVARSEDDHVEVARRIPAPILAPFQTELREL